MSQISRIRFRDNDSGKILHEVDGENLDGVSLSGVNLSGAAMYAVEIDPADFHSHLPAYSTQKIQLTRVDLSEADLHGAVFSEETIIGVNFSRANLEGAVFVRSHLINCELNGANLTRARLMNTCFTNCHSLHLAIGLDELEHSGRSILDVQTLRSCISKLPNNVLLGMGYTDKEIATFRSLYEKEKTFFSCFISYARADYNFADYLRRRLLKRNISCWQDTHDMRGGGYWRGQIYDAIDKHDKLILVCSRASLTRPAVVEEILEAINRERRTGEQKLFPIRLDDYIFSDELDGIAHSKVAGGQWKEDWVVYVRSYHIPDFSRWQEARHFSLEFNKLVEALKKPARR